MVQKAKKPFGTQMKTGGQAEGHGHIGVLSRDMLCYVIGGKSIPTFCSLPVGC